MMNPHDKIVSALTQWDTKQSKKKGHNSHFLGIALVSLSNIEEELPSATAEELAREAFEGRLLDFVLKSL
jgi:hypothetical protein